MVSATDCNDNDEKVQFFLPIKDIASENVEETQSSSHIPQEGSEQQSYDSDGGNSDCSVTSGLNGHTHAKLVFFSRKQVGYSTAEESGGTTWTDEKHSSYLDSMEAKFVQKMYDKEYCSMDVCGHSATSSLTLDHECVESQPFCLNMRKPSEGKVAGQLTSRAPARAMTLAPMLASPWIQHFKSQKSAPWLNGNNQRKDAQHSPTKEVRKKPSRVNLYSGKGSRLGNISASKQTDFVCASESAECKKQKCQHLSLSQIDILMEQQFNKEQQRNVGINEAMKAEDVEDEPTETSEKWYEHREEVLSCKNVTVSDQNLLKEQQTLTARRVDSDPPSLGVNGVFSQKPDQVVPSYKITTQAKGKMSSAGTFCAAISEPESVSNPSGSKTWTWSN